MMHTTSSAVSGGMRSVLPVFLSALALQGVISLFNIDFIWSRWLFEQEGGQWLLKDHWLLSEVIHNGGRELSVLLALGCILAFLLSFVLGSLRSHRYLLAYLACAPLVAAGVVSLGKQFSGVACPWSLQQLGGELPYIPLVQQLFAPSEGACFPAGHASAGYAWFALYFAAAEFWPQLRHRILVTVLFIGALFGFAQQLRGAHFLSHDLWSLVVCWSVCALLAPRLLRRSREQAMIRFAWEGDRDYGSADGITGGR